MSFAGDKGIVLDLEEKVNYTKYFFNEELGLVVETDPCNTNYVINKLKHHTPVKKIGTITQDDIVKIIFNGEEIINCQMTELRNSWEHNSFCFEKHEIPEKLANIENNLYKTINSPKYYVPDEIYAGINDKIVDKIPVEYKVAILREEGSNGEKEMAAAFRLAGFQVWDVNTYDLINNPYLLNTFVGLVFVGGFSFSDVTGSADGWYQSIMNNQSIKNLILKFLQKA